MIVMSLDEIKEMMLFCKTNKIKAAKLGDVSFEFSEASLYSEEIATIIPQKEETGSSKTLIDTEEQLDSDEYEKLLYHSSNS